MRRVVRRGVTLHVDANEAEVESADIAFASSGTHRQELEELLRQHPGGLTMHQCVELLGWNSRDNVNPRMQELKAMGVVVPTDEKRPTGLGGVATVWLHVKFTTRHRVTPKPLPSKIPSRSAEERVRKQAQRGRRTKSDDRPARPDMTDEERRLKQKQLRQRAGLL